ncbi:COP9 signalosome (CSN) subunit [Apophysomyces ossiformis]|uniref:COP9 signalosome (CSN) subunit n=1 Tax=Apophysomyces ossiformis TaxID=679940 RepID=A0A8H7EST5_9FUNG|nr:COP9 signalosome (CSN) subunit [Apophysomyces ossiformis]
MKAFQLYLSKIQTYSNSENGKNLANLFSINDYHISSLLEQNIQVNKLEPMCRNRLGSPWDDMALGHLKAAVFMDQGQYVEAFEAQKDVVQAFQRSMSGFTRWCLPILYVINNDLRIIASKADDEVATDGQRKKLEEAANVISKSFTYCITDRGVMSTSRKYGTYCMIGILFRIYFKLKQQNLCKNILRALGAADMPSIDEFPKSDRVTFWYYLGRLHFLQEDYNKAEQELEMAFRECANSHRRNKELILQTLLPIRLMRGVLPTRTLLERFPKARHTYGALADALKCGDVKGFNEALVASEAVLIRQGTYFAVEKAQSIVIRQLFRKV